MAPGKLLSVPDQDRISQSALAKQVQLVFARREIDRRKSPGRDFAIDCRGESGGDKGARRALHNAGALFRLRCVIPGGARLRRAEGGAHPRSPESRPTGGYRASFGRMQERSAGKDSTTGHWEIAGAILEKPFATFDKFPDELVREIERRTGVHFLGNYPRSGTAILDELGPEHLRTGQPILYTSADSVLQIAGHEEIIPVERLYEICRSARAAADRYRIGRVIARPFIGQPGAFQRTARRHDFSLAPPFTILTALNAASVNVISVGKVADIFAGEGITVRTKTAQPPNVK